MRLTLIDCLIPAVPIVVFFSLIRLWNIAARGLRLGSAKRIVPA